jgi:glutamate-1-semialdehyde 2,1-aminomutase
MTAGSESIAWFDRARAVLPGGVNSPVRAYGAVGGQPLVIAGARGATITDVDGNEYLDFVGSWGPLILGHAHPRVLDAIHWTAARGTSYGAPCRPEIELAEKVVSLYPGLEQVRFVSSGTEAVMSALRLARGATGRKLVVKFEGCYHGHVDHMLVAAGSGLVTLGQPSSAGVPEEFTGLTRVLPLAETEALDSLFASEGDQVAAVIIEPVPANNGLLLQSREYLGHLRELCSRHGAVLIFDEVISGFRLGPGGAAEAYGIQPDLATFGKVIGGGMPVGAFGGREDIMRELAPLGGVYQAGTLSGNPVAMAAGLATLETLEAEDGWARLSELGAHFGQQLATVLQQTAASAALARNESIFWLALGSTTLPRAASEIAAGAADTYAGIFRALLAEGIALAPSAYEVGFISLAHTENDLDRLAEALGTVFAG